MPGRIGRRSSASGLARAKRRAARPPARRGERSVMFGTFDGGRDGWPLISSSGPAPGRAPASRADRAQDHCKCGPITAHARLRAVPETLRPNTGQTLLQLRQDVVFDAPAAINDLGARDVAVAAVVDGDDEVEDHRAESDQRTTGAGSRKN